MTMGNPEDTRSVVVMDKALAGPLFMLSAALLFTALNLLIKTGCKQLKSPDVPTKELRH